MIGTTTSLTRQIYCLNELQKYNLEPNTHDFIKDQIMRGYSVNAKLTGNKLKSFSMFMKEEQNLKIQII